MFFGVSSPEMKAFDSVKYSCTKIDGLKFVY